MKKIFLMLAAALVACSSCIAAAPSKEMLDASAKRIEQLQKLLEKEPKLGATPELDALQQKTKEAATLAVLNSAMIVKMATEGTNVGDVVALGVNVTDEGKAVKAASELVEPASKSLKSLSPLKAGGAKKSLDFSSNCLKLLTEESVAQAQMVAELAK